METQPAPIKNPKSESGKRAVAFDRRDRPSLQDWFKSGCAGGGGISEAAGARF